MAWLGPVGSSCETKVGWCAAKGKKLKKNDLEGEANGCFFNGCVTSLCNLCLNICVGAWTVSLLLYFCHQRKVLKLSVNYSYSVRASSSCGWFCYSEVPGPRPRSFPQDANVLRGEQLLFQSFPSRPLDPRPLPSRLPGQLRDHSG